jgi:hypothetical protein
MQEYGGRVRPLAGREDHGVSQVHSERDEGTSRSV